MDSVKKFNNMIEEKNIGFNDIITCSEDMLSLITTAKTASQSKMTVLLTGESGTGKELFARATHNKSPRKNNPFVVINCAGIPDTLLESELFGHEKGSFTDAVSLKKGKFELAHGGTLFLDEIGDLSPIAQAKALRAVEEKRFERVGGEKTISVDCRIIAATNKDLFREVKEGRFREDLYYRLHEIHLHLPSLRDRKQDIPLLINHFIRDFNRVFNKNIKGPSKVTLSYLMMHHWPGNIRELKGVIKSSVALVERDTIWIEDLPFKIELMNEQADSLFDEDLSLKSAEKKHLFKVLTFTKWNKTKTVGLLKITRPTLDKKIKEYRLVPQHSQENHLR
ncbi:MAG: sigma-54-dependent Fis family transcriptional regulator [Candidatus Omnitrophica bacterium]|nr:sigma-54-dependent Fis family transcriptional regulator [Candidatus Omnitrophota bacterium]